MSRAPSPSPFDASFVPFPPTSLYGTSYHTASHERQMVRYLIILHYVLLKQDSHGLRQVLPTPAGLMSATDMGVPSLPLNITSFLPGAMSCSRRTRHS